MVDHSRTQFPQQPSLQLPSPPSIFRVRTRCDVLGCCCTASHQSVTVEFVRRNTKDIHTGGDVILNQGFVTRRSSMIHTDTGEAVRAKSEIHALWSAILEQSTDTTDDNWPYMRNELLMVNSLWTGHNTK